MRPLRNSELRVVQLVVQGKSNKDIAAELNISYQVVKQHLIAAYRVLGVSSRYELMSVWFQSGLRGGYADRRPSLT